MWLLVCAGLCLNAVEACTPSVTTVGGTHAPTSVCSGKLIFNDEFNNFNLDIWQHENTLAGGGNGGEFQYYNNNRTNSFTHNGKLFIRPSLTSDHFGEEFLANGRLNVEEVPYAGRCTNRHWSGCERTGTPTKILNPIKSARIRTMHSFSFRYGRVEVRAKMPAGDWLWPAIWLMPAHTKYGKWPLSGEMDLVESRGNRNLYSDGVNIGIQHVAATLHFGPYKEFNEWRRAHWSSNNTLGFDKQFHKYQLEWTPDYIKFSVDNVELGRVTPGRGGFWEYGEFSSNPGVQNTWSSGSKMAPFDKQFYFIINLAVGGTSGYFPDGAWNPDQKPWTNYSPKAATDFWYGRWAWLPTWNLGVNDGQDASVQVDYVRVWAL